MKQIRTYLVVTILAVVSFLLPQHLYAQEVPHQQTIDNFLEEYFEWVVEQPDTKERLTTVRMKIDAYLSMSFTTEIRLALTYVNQQVAQFQTSLQELPPTEGDPDEDEQSDTDDDQDAEQATIDTSRYFPGDKTILAGEISPPVVKLEYTAQLEDVIIEDLTVSSSHDLSLLFSAIHFYNEDSTHHSSWTVAGDDTTLQNINLYIPQHTTAFYVTLEPHAIGYQQLGEQQEDVRLTFTPAKAVGQITNDQINAGSWAASSDDIDIVPVHIEDVDFVQAAAGYQAGTTLYDGQVNLAILKLTADDRENKRSDSQQKLSLLLKQLSLHVEDGTTAGDVADNLELVRIDTNSTTPLQSTSSQNNALFDFTEEPNVRTIDAGETAYFLVRGDITLDDETKESVKIVLNKLNAGSIVYQSNDPGAQEVDALHLGQSVLEGNSLVE